MMPLIFLGEDKMNSIEEGRRIYALPWEQLSVQELLKIYAYILDKWGDSIYLQLITDTITKKQTEVDILYEELEDIRKRNNQLDDENKALIDEVDSLNDELDRKSEGY